ncbi:MAG: hypothetical protein GY930_17530 [bacterium]|nr:hypothetical protein [bacterium]
MKNLALGPFFLVIALGCASAVITSVLLSEEKVQPLTGVGPTLDLAAELNALRQENETLSARISDLELRPMSQERVSALETPSSDASAFEQEVRAWMKQMQSKSVASPSIFHSDVQDALATIRGQEAVQRAEVKRRQRDEWISGTIAKLAPDLGLSQQQTREMETAWLAKAELDAELSRLWKSGEMGREELGHMKETNEQQHQDSLRGFLLPQQYEEYTTMVSGSRGAAKGK